MVGYILFLCLQNVLYIVTGTIKEILATSNSANYALLKIMETKNLLKQNLLELNQSFLFSIFY